MNPNERQQNISSAGSQQAMAQNSSDAQQNNEVTQQTAQPVQPVQPITTTNREKVNTHMGIAIASIFGTWPLAIPAIMKANKSKKALAMGNVAEAQKTSKSAFAWSMASFITAGVLVICTVAIILVASKPTAGGSDRSGFDKIKGQWTQTARGLYFKDDPGAEPDYLDIREDETLTWYGNVNDKSKDHMVGRYKIEFGNKSNDEGQIMVGSYIIYTLTVTPDYYIDGQGERKEYAGTPLQYVIYIDPADSSSFNAIGLKNINGFRFTK